jgi:hypothetical protein
MDQEQFQNVLIYLYGFARYFIYVLMSFVSIVLTTKHLPTCLTTKEQIYVNNRFRSLFLQDNISTINIKLHQK